MRRRKKSLPNNDKVGGKMNTNTHARTNTKCKQMDERSNQPKWISLFTMYFKCNGHCVSVRECRTFFWESFHDKMITTWLLYWENLSPSLCVDFHTQVSFTRITFIPIACWKYVAVGFLCYVPIECVVFRGKTTHSLLFHLKVNRTMFVSCMRWMIFNGPNDIDPSREERN